MTLTETEVEYLRTDREAMIRTLALQYNELDNRLAKYPILTTAFIVATADELDVTECTTVKAPFLIYCDALAVRADFDLDPDSWMDRNDHTSHFTAKDIVDSDVTAALCSLLALAVR